MEIRIKSEKVRAFPLKLIINEAQTDRYYVLADGGVFDKNSGIITTGWITVVFYSGHMGDYMTRSLFETAKKHNEWSKHMVEIKELFTGKYMIGYHENGVWVCLNQVFDTDGQVIAAIQQQCKENPGIEYLKLKIERTAFLPNAIVWK